MYTDKIHKNCKIDFYESFKDCFQQRLKSSHFFESS